GVSALPGRPPSVRSLPGVDHQRSADDTSCIGASGLNIADALDSVWAGHVRRFLGHLAAECGLAENTIIAYGRDLREFAELLAARALKCPDEITPLVVQSHLIQLGGRGLALPSIARHLASLRMF